MGRLIDADVLIEYLWKYHYPDVFVQGSEDGIELREVTYNQFYDIHGDYLGDENETTLDNIFRRIPHIECLED